MSPYNGDVVQILALLEGYPDAYAFYESQLRGTRLKHEYSILRPIHLIDSYSVRDAISLEQRGSSMLGVADLLKNLKRSTDQHVMVNDLSNDTASLLVITNESRSVAFGVLCFLNNRVVLEKGKDELNKTKSD